METDPAQTPLAFASEPWFEHARRLTAALPAKPGLGWRLQFDATDESGEHYRWHQVVEDGQVVAWEAGDVDQPDLEVRWSLADARAVHRQELSGTEALAAARVVDSDGLEGAAPPLDIGATPELARLPVVPGASLVLQFEFSDGPFGPVSFWETFEDGVITGLDFGRAEEPDVTVGISFQRMVLVRTDAMTVLEALEDGGKIDGALGPLMLLAGLQESPELHAAEMACGPAGAVLARVGGLTSCAEYRDAMAALAQATG